MSGQRPRLWVLDGQGSFAATSPDTIRLALRDSETSIGRTLLLACHAAFINDLASLSPEERAMTGLSHEGFLNAKALLTSCREHPTNAIIANTTLFLFQILRYLAQTDLTNLSGETLPSDLGVIGFSTGLFAASVISSAHSIPSLLSYAVEAFRLAFWLGFRAQQFASSETPHDLTSPWSLVVLGSTRTEIDGALKKFMEENTESRVHLTAVLHSTCVTVSGRPHTLSVFRDSFLPSTAHTTKFAAIHTLYHSSELLGVKNRVLEDVARRGIQYPPISALRRPLGSTSTGAFLSTMCNNNTPSLVESVVEMILLDTVNYDAVVSNVAATLSSSREQCEIVNLGPGNTLCKIMTRAIPVSQASVVDWARDEINHDRVLGPIHHDNESPDSIAIVGMSVKFPGADDAKSLWGILENGLNTVSEVPSARFSVSSDVAAPKSSHPNRVFTGNFIQEPWMFDNGFFRVSPREARSMDPQQRVLLQTSYHALQNAGYVPGATPTFDPATFGTYVGVATNDYVQNLRKNIDIYYSTGTLQAFLSGKISFAFGFSGPSVVVDTACSSSMVAIYQACRALTSGDCNAALAGGVNVITSPDMYIGLDRAHFLSPNGQCKPWDASADGYSRAEGCGMFVLKRLSDAQKENDRILGVIRGVEVNQSGNAESITRPHAPTQMNLFRRLVSRTGIEANRISVVEAHGTGTQAGDPVELEAIRAVFARNRSNSNPLHVTSIKANIGHAEAASGAASLAKLILMFQHQTIPALISLRQLNPKIPDLIKDHTRIDTQNTPWVSPTGHRFALLNNFGAAGSNVAMVLEEPPDQPVRNHPTTFASFFLGLSCDSEDAIEDLRSMYLRHLERVDDDRVELADFCYTATARRQLHTYRISTFGRCKKSLCENLSKTQVLRTNDLPGKVVFVFSGMGGQYQGMGARIYDSVPSFRRSVDHCDRVLVHKGYPSILQLLTSQEMAQGNLDIPVVHSAIFVLEYALASLWMQWGILPDAVVGHSLGEYAAMVIAGVLGLEDALGLVAGRGRLMSEKCLLGHSGMLAVQANSSQVSRLLEGYEGLSIACHNSSSGCVVGGPLASLSLLEKNLKNSGIKCISVNVPFAQHASAMDPILSHLTNLAEPVHISAPSIPIVSTVLGKLVPIGDSSVFNIDYFSRHCREPVYFERGIDSLLSSEDFTSVSAWIEIGPHPTCLPMLRSIPTTSDQALYLPSLRKTVPSEETMTSALSNLYTKGPTINWRRVFKDLYPHAHLVELPNYPFARNKFWVPYEVEQPALSTDTQLPKHALITRCNLSDSWPAIFEADIEKMAPLIEGHQIAEFGLCPASLYTELATASIHHALGRAPTGDAALSVSLSDLSFPYPLVYTSDVHKTIRVSVFGEGGPTSENGHFEIASYSSGSPEHRSHCVGTFTIRSSHIVASHLSTTAPANPDRDSIMASGESETFRTHTAYNLIFSKIVNYSSSYQAIRSITIDRDRTNAYADCMVPAQDFSGPFVTHPVFTDTLLHVAGFIVNLNCGTNEAFICHHIERVTILAELVRDSAFEVYCNVRSLSTTGAVADVYAVDASGDIRRHVIACLEGAQFKKLRLSGFRSLLASSRSPTSSTNTTPASFPLTPVTEERPSGRPARTAEIRDILSSILDIPPHTINEHDDLHRLGLDSLASIEVHHALCSTLKVNLPEALFATCKNLKDIQDAVSRCSERDISLGKEIAATFLSSPSTPFPLELKNPHRRDRLVGAPPPSGVHAKGFRVREILASVLDVAVSQLDDETELERLGLDSLMTIEIQHTLSSSLGIHLPQDTFASKTVGHLESAITSRLPTVSGPPHRRQDEAAGIRDTLILLQSYPHSQLDPLFLIHDGSGSANCYRKLSPLGRMVWGIQNSRFGSGEAWEGGVIAMAKRYVDTITNELRGRRRCVVGGWSFGGVVSFEVARRLIKSGIEVSALILIDSPDPRTKSPLPDSVIDSIFSPKPNASQQAQRLMESTRAEMRLATAALVDYDHKSSSARDVQVERAIILCCEDELPLPSSDNSEAAMWLTDRKDISKVVAGWKEVLGGTLEAIEIPGNHFEPFQSHNVGTVSDVLKTALSMFE